MMNPLSTQDKIELLNAILLRIKEIKTNESVTTAKK